MRRPAFAIALGAPQPMPAFPALPLLLSTLLQFSPMNTAVAEPSNLTASNLAGAARRAHVHKVIGQGPAQGAAVPTEARAGASKAVSDGAGADPAAQGRHDYMLHCSGCHTADGDPSPLGGIPALKGRIGHFMALPEGRAFLVQVPGVNNTGLNDAAIAGVLNWVVPHFAGSSLPGAFVPYTEQEVARFRAQRPVDMPTYRKDLARRLAQSGHAIDY